MQKVAEYLGIEIVIRTVSKETGLVASGDVFERPVATPSRVPLMLPAATTAPDNSALATGQLTLEQLSACQFKTYPNQPSIPSRVPCEESMRQLTLGELLNGSKVASPSTTIATTVLETDGSLSATPPPPPPIHDEAV